MPKTKELTITCNEARVVPNRYNVVTVYIDEPNVEDALMSFHSDDLIAYVTANYDIEEVFDEKEIKKWAEENGYIKE